MALTISVTFTDGTTISAADLTTLVTEVQNKFGNIDNSDIKSNAAIDVDKLSAQYERVVVTGYVYAEQLASGWPASGTLAAIPIPGSNGDPAWTMTDVIWSCTDTGGGTGTFKLQLGEYATGSWASATDIGSADTIDNGAVADDANSGVLLSGGSVSIAYDTNPQFIGIVATGADATTLTAAGSFLSVSVTLRRKITDTTV